MLSKVKFDTVIALLLMFLGVVFWFAIGTAPSRVRYYPRYIILIMFVPVVILLIRSFLPRYREKLPDLQLQLNRKVISCIVSTLAYIFLIPLVGYYSTTFIFITGIMVFLGARKWFIIGGVTIGMVLFVYFMFTRLLLISLPKGFLF